MVVLSLWLAAFAYGLWCLGRRPFDATMVFGFFGFIAVCLVTVELAPSSPAGDRRGWSPCRQLVAEGGQVAQSGSGRSQWAHYGCHAKGYRLLCEFPREGCDGEGRSDGRHEL